jgi:DNA-binding response OmpR family regulator
MKILIAEDDITSRRLLDAFLVSWGYETVLAHDGLEAWELLQAHDNVGIVILDWMMPKMDGLEVCRKIRTAALTRPLYLIMLTARDGTDDMVTALTEGADDYLTKPFNRDELRSRIQVGLRTLTLQQNLADRVRELEAALMEVRQLKELLPICCYCKKIRDDQDYWQQVESYLAVHAGVRFSHGICPACFEAAVQDDLDSFLSQRPD